MLRATVKKSWAVSIKGSIKSIGYIADLRTRELPIGELPQSHHKTSIRRKVTMLLPVLLKQRCAESPSSPGDHRGPVAHSYFAAWIARRRWLTPAKSSNFQPRRDAI